MPPRRSVVLLGLSLLLALAWPGALAQAQDQPPEELTLILDSPDRPGLPRHYRAASDTLSSDLAEPPALAGLAGLRVSGSAQFSRAQLAELLTLLPRPLTVVDLRQESHGFLSGLAVSWYGPRDFANQGKTLEQVRADEQERLERAQSAGRVVVAEVLAKDAQDAIAQSEPFTLEVASAQTEAQLMALEGLDYLRLAVTDHLRPLDQTVEDFLAYWRGLPPGTWLHFHCHAGEGRTTTFMLMADILANAGRVSLEDLARRQELLGGMDLLSSPPESWKRQAYLERAAFLRGFYEFVRQGPAGQPGSWLAWVQPPEAQAATPPAPEPAP